MSQKRASLIGGSPDVHFGILLLLSGGVVHLGFHRTDCRIGSRATQRRPSPRLARTGGMSRS
jgi:hypothetical protein